MGIPFRLPDFELGEVRMEGIEQIVVLIGDEDAGYGEDGGRGLSSPAITDGLGRRRWGIGIPAVGEVSRSDGGQEGLVEAHADEDVCGEV